MTALDRWMVVDRRRKPIVWNLTAREAAHDAARIVSIDGTDPPYSVVHYTIAAGDDVDVYPRSESGVVG